MSRKVRPARVDRCTRPVWCALYDAVSCPPSLSSGATTHADPLALLSVLLVSLQIIPDEHAQFRLQYESYSVVWEAGPLLKWDWKNSGQVSTSGVGTLCAPLLQFVVNAVVCGTCLSTRTRPIYMSHFTVTLFQTPDAPQTFNSLSTLWTNCEQACSR